MNTYRVFGLTIRSSMAFPGLPETLGKADVEIGLGFVPGSRAGADGESGGMGIGDRSMVVYERQIGRFLIASGQTILVDPAPGVHDHLLSSYLLRIILPVILYQRGCLLLHASAVVVGQYAGMFIGASGRGKSTTAAAFYSHGYGLVADDLVAVDLTSKDGPRVLPGAPEVCLLPDAAAQMTNWCQQLSMSAPGVGKQVLDTSARAYYGPVPLRHIYVLSDGPTIAIEPIGLTHAVLEVLRHGAATRLVSAMGKVDVLLGQCAALSQQAPVYSLTRPRRLASLPDVVQRIEAHLARP